MRIAYGVCLESELALDHLPECDEEPSAAVTLSWEPSGSITGSSASYRDGEAILSYAGLCRVKISRGRRIDVDGERGTPEAVLEHFVVGVGMGVLLHQRQRLALHASAVLSPIGGVLFLGGPTWGKSTVAAAHYVRGWPLIADDIAAFVLDTGAEARIMPAYPSLRLWPETARYLRLEDDAEPIYPGARKLRVDAGTGFSTAAAPAAAVYLLAPGSHLAIEPVRPHEAVAEFIRHSFAGNLLAESGPQPWHFEAVVELARRVPLKRLTSPRTGLKGLEQVLEAVEADLVTADRQPR